MPNPEYYLKANSPCQETWGQDCWLAFNCSFQQPFTDYQHPTHAHTLQCLVEWHCSLGDACYQATGNIPHWCKVLSRWSAHKDQEAKVWQEQEAEATGWGGKKWRWGQGEWEQGYKSKTASTKSTTRKPCCNVKVPLRSRSVIDNCDEEEGN